MKRIGRGTMGRRKIVKPGTKVAHKLHGHGVIVGTSDDPDGVVVRFDQTHPKWATDTWEVSSALLTKRWGRAARDGSDTAKKNGIETAVPRE